MRTLAAFLFPIALCASPGFFRVGTGQTYSAGCPSACSGVATALAAANSAAASTGEPQVVELNAFSVSSDVFTAWQWPTRARVGPWVVVRTSRVGEFGADTRVDKTSTALAHVVGVASTACDVTGTLNANHYMVQGLSFTNTTYSVAMVSLDCPQEGINGSFTGRPAFWLQDWICNWCVMEIPNSLLQRRLLNVAGDRVKIYNSYFGGGHEPGADSQSIAGVNVGDGFTLQNSTLYGLGSTETFIFGGSVPIQANVHATNATFIGNYILAPFKGRRRTSPSSDPPTFTGDDCAYDPDDNLGEWWWRQDTDLSWQCDTGVWVSRTTAAMHAYTDTFVVTVPGPFIIPTRKNNFELKNLRGGQIEGNVFYGGFGPFIDNQQGSIVLVNNVDNEHGNGEWRAMIRDVTFINNKFDNAGRGVGQSSLGSYLYKQKVDFLNNQWTRMATYLNNDRTIFNSSPEFYQLSGDQGDIIGGKVDGPAATLVMNNTHIWSGIAGAGSQALADIVTVGFDATSTTGKVQIKNNVMDGESIMFYTGNGSGGSYNALPTNCIGTNGCVFGKNLVSQSQSCIGAFLSLKCVPMSLMWPNDINGSRAGYASAYPGWITSEPPDLTVWVPQSTFLTSPGTGDYSVKAAYIGAALNGDTPGVRYSAYNAAIAGAVSGTFPAYLRWFNPPTFTLYNAAVPSGPATGTVTVEYNSPVAGTCSVLLSVNAATTSGFTFTDGGGIVGSHRTVNASAGLTVGTRYWGQATCGTGTRQFGPFILR